MGRFSVLTALACALATAPSAAAQKPQYPPAFPPTPILASAVNYAPSVTPNVMDKTAPSAQQACPGYKASGVSENSAGFTADLTLAGPACNVYGNDIRDLTLAVQYQSKERLSVKIQPKYLDATNRSQYLLDGALTPLPGVEKGACEVESDLRFKWTNEPTFSFNVTRAKTNEVLYSTYGSKIVFEDQFLEMSTSMVKDYNMYGLAECLRGFRVPNNYTQTFWNAYNLDNDQILDVNAHSVHPMYLETRYGADNKSTSHGVYSRNAHGQDWLMRPSNLTLRTIGGSFDLYFVSGDSPTKVISQYQTGIVNTPVMQPYWALGFHQVRWGYQNWTNLQDVIDDYAALGIPLEGIMNDLDYLKMNRDFTDNPGHYDVDQGREFLERLHANGQYYLPILDPNVYIPNPDNTSDAYSTYDRGAAVDAYIRNGDDGYYIGVEWPGFSVFPDFLVQAARDFWVNEIKMFQQVIPFDGFWLDVSDPVSYCTGSCGTGELQKNPIHVPFALPGDPNTSISVDFRYPEMFAVTNMSEAASAASAMMSQSAMYPTPAATPTPVYNRTVPTPGVRNLNYPPYAINNFLPGHALTKEVVSPNATHNDGPHNSTEYELHNLYGHLSANATYHGLLEARPGRRPFMMARSTFAGSGNFTGHWGGDTNSMWGNMYFGIPQALQFSIAGIPYFGVETCGFNGNADMELCTRWMQLSAWFPMYRNHNNRNTIAQEAYRWATTAVSTRNIINIRYSILPYTYTLFHRANVAGETVLRALAWEFPNDPQLKAVETQFMSGPALLVTPVLAPLATNVSGVFPGVADGTRWYDWYNLTEVNAKPGENKTLDAPLEKMPIHVRGGYVLPIQKAGNTTKASRQSPWSLLVALDKDGAAQGELFLDDGINVVQNATKNVKVSFSCFVALCFASRSCDFERMGVETDTTQQFNYANGTLTSAVCGSFNDHLPLANLTIAGIKARPQSATIQLGGKTANATGARFNYTGDVLRVTGLNNATAAGVFSGEMEIKLS